MGPNSKPAYRTGKGMKIWAWWVYLVCIWAHVRLTLGFMSRSCGVIFSQIWAMSQKRFIAELSGRNLGVGNVCGMYVDSFDLDHPKVVLGHSGYLS